MSLPEIPADAWNKAAAAAEKAAGEWLPLDIRYGAARAMWPHLYAAALNYAADQWDAVIQSEDFSRVQRPGIALMVRSLRGMAATAAPPSPGDGEPGE